MNNSFASSVARVLLLEVLLLLRALGARLPARAVLAGLGPERGPGQRKLTKVDRQIWQLFTNFSNI